jgi:hypothetical protein
MVSRREEPSKAQRSGPQALTRILIGLTEADSGAELPAGVAGHYLNNQALSMFMLIQYVLVTWTYGAAIVSTC